MPPQRAAVPGSACAQGVKTLSSCSDDIPAPVLETRISSVPAATDAATRIVPLSVSRAALLSRFRSTCRSFPSSEKTVPSPSSPEVSRRF